MYDLSILIPARNEAYLAETVKGLLENKRGKTEILIGLDGAWANPPIQDHEDVRILYYPKSIGQRAMTNQLARLSQAKYVMKLDAHCAVGEGFDTILMADMEDDMTVIPAMYNLHVFDWVCISCGKRWYQSPTPTFCHADYEAKPDQAKRNPLCNNTTEFKKEIVWKKRENRKSYYYRFDKTLHFQYWGSYGDRPEAQGDVVEIMSAQGSCFMLTRKKYWELDICDELHGSWGQQGVEVGMKTWLSGGRLMVNKKTWYAHLFRTQGGDFGFPYPNPQKEIEKAREYSKDLWMNDRWDKALPGRNLQWLLDKFAPVPDWHDPVPKIPEAKRKGIIYYTDNKLNIKIAKTVRKQLLKMELPIVSSSLKPIDFGKNVHLPLQRGYLTMAKQILAALEASDSEIVYFCEHDVMYHPSHFEFTPQRRDRYYYNTNVWRVRIADGHALWCDDLQQLSGLVGYRDTLLTHFRKRVEIMEKKLEEIEKAHDDEFFGQGLADSLIIDQEFNSFVRAMGFEPGTHGRPERVDDIKAENYKAAFPNIDIRHDTNLTASRWNKEQFRNEKYTRGWKETTLKDPLNSFMESSKLLASI